MSLRTGSFLLGVLLLTILSPPVMAQPDLAQVMVGKSMSKILDSNTRRSLRIDIETTIENYDANSNLKSRKIENKTTDGRLDVRGITMEELYQAFKTRYDFYIDTTQSTAVINNTTYAIVKFKPKSNLVIKKTADQFINRTKGSMYIDLDNFDLIRVDGYIEYPFSFTFAWYFIPIASVNVYQFEFSVEYTSFNNMLVEKSINGLADYEIRNRGIEKFTNKITNHRMRN